MISPTGRGIRYDEEGAGNYGARRDGGKRRHLGIDFLSTEGQTIVVPFYMKIVRRANPSADKPKLSGIAFETEWCTGKMFYFDPDKRFLGSWVKEGLVIGTQQSLKEYYGPKMLDHVHLQFDSIDPNLFLKQLVNGIPVNIP